MIDQFSIRKGGEWWSEIECCVSVWDTRLLLSSGDPANAVLSGCPPGK